MRALTAVASLVALLLSGTGTAQRRTATLDPVTVAERSGFAATATADELRTFLEAVVAAAPPGRLAGEAGVSAEHPDDGRLVEPANGVFKADVRAVAGGRALRRHRDDGGDEDEKAEFRDADRDRHVEPLTSR